MWSGHSPSEINTKVKDGGQECPPYTVKGTELALVPE
jgi:hypothetical protein